MVLAWFCSIFWGGCVAVTFATGPGGLQHCGAARAWSECVSTCFWDEGGVAGPGGTSARVARAAGLRMFIGCRISVTDEDA